MGRSMIPDDEGFWRLLPAQGWFFGAICKTTRRIHIQQQNNQNKNGIDGVKSYWNNKKKKRQFRACALEVRLSDLTSVHSQIFWVCTLEVHLSVLPSEHSKFLVQFYECTLKRAALCGKRTASVPAKIHQNPAKTTQSSIFNHEIHP